MQRTFWFYYRLKQDRKIIIQAEWVKLVVGQTGIDDAREATHATQVGKGAGAETALDGRRSEKILPAGVDALQEKDIGQ